MMMKLRGGTAALQIEVDRWKGKSGKGRETMQGMQ